MLQLLRYNWKLGVAALTTVILCRALLWLVPFRWLQRWVKLERPDPSIPPDFARRRRFAAAVRVASRCVPAATCLTQALSTLAMLKLKGDTVPLLLGVARSGDGVFQAHAWLESDGRVLIGDLPDLARYQRLSSQRILT